VTSANPFAYNVTYPPNWVSSGSAGSPAPGATALANPTADITAYAARAMGQLYPVVLAVAGAVVALFVLWWGVNAVLRVLNPTPEVGLNAAAVNSGDFSSPDDLDAQVLEGFASVGGGAVDGGGSFV
jgi:hypothetical protein